MNTMIDFSIKYLSNNDLSEFELRNIIAKHFSSLDDLYTRIDSTLSYLKKLNLVNDKRFAISLINKSADKSKRIMSCELKQKGIDNTIIQSLLMKDIDNISNLY